MINVLIADDHAIVRRGLKEILAHTSDIVVGGEAVNSAEVLEQVLARRFDVVVLDITMPGGSGLDTVRDVKHDRPGLPVLMLSVHPEDQYAALVLKEGASGYLPKEAAPEELVNAIRKIHTGAKYIRPSQTEAPNGDCRFNQPLLLLRHYSHGFVHIRQFSSLKNDAIHKDSVRNVSLVSFNDKMKNSAHLRFESGLLRHAANHPPRALPHHFTRVVHEKNSGSRRLDSVRVVIGQPQRYHGLLTYMLRASHGKIELRLK
jgi:YesN/AraC family two-component response regulator